MKFLFKVTRNGINTLLRGVDFIHNYEKITFVNDFKIIKIEELGKIVESEEGEYVAYTPYKSDCEQIQQNLIKKYKEG